MKYFQRQRKRYGLALALLPWAMVTHANDLVPVTDVVDVNSGGYGGDDICVVLSSGAVKCYRSLVPGKVPNTYIHDRLILQGFVEDFPELSNVKKFAISHGSGTRMNGNCAITTAGGAICWGKPYYLGIGIEKRDDYYPTGKAEFATPVGLENGVESIALGYEHACALMTTGEVKCWGVTENYLGIGPKPATDSNWHTKGQSPNSVITLDNANHYVNLDNAIAIAAASESTCALLSNHTVKCWGSNWNKALGSETASSSYADFAVDYTKLTDVKAITAGYGHVCALTNAGAVKCWGLNDSGQLGNGTRTTSSSPVDVTGLNSGVVAIAAGHDHTCAILEQGNVKCWGYNRFGQLGNDQHNVNYGGGGHTGTMLPVDVIGKDGQGGLGGKAVKLIAGYSSTCALMEDSTVKCWGSQLLWNHQRDGIVGDLSPASSKIITVMMEKPQTPGAQVSAPTDGLVAYYPFDSDANDASGHGHHGIVSGVEDLDVAAVMYSGKPRFMAGKIGNAVRFSGIRGGKIEFPTIDKTYFGTNDFTLSFFVKFNLKKTKMAPLSKRGAVGSPSPFLDIRVSDYYDAAYDAYDDYAYRYDPSVEINDGKKSVFVIYGRPLATDTWYSLTLVRQEKTISIYVDGQLTRQKTTETVADLSSDALFGINNNPLMGYDNLTDFSGKLDELRVYNRALTAEEVTILIPEVGCPSGSQRGLAIDSTGQAVKTKTCFQNSIRTPQGLQANYSRLAPSAKNAGNIRLSVTATPETAHVGKSADSFIVAYIPTLVTPSILMKVGSNWELWDEDLTALKAATPYPQLPTSFEEIVFDGAFTDDLLGNYTVFVGYRLDDGTLVYNGVEPLSFFVRP